MARKNNDTSALSTIVLKMIRAFVLAICESDFFFVIGYISATRFISLYSGKLICIVIIIIVEAPR